MKLISHCSDISSKPLLFNQLENINKSTAKQLFVREFFYNYIELFHEICSMHKIHSLENNIIIDIIMWSEIDCIYALSFWINSQIIDITLRNAISDEDANVLSGFSRGNLEKNFSYDSYTLITKINEPASRHFLESALIPKGWFINVTPYYYEQHSNNGGYILSNIIYKVILRLQEKPLSESRYYHRIICQYMANNDIYYVNKTYIEWGIPKHIVIGTKNNKLLNFSISTPDSTLIKQRKSTINN